MLAVAEVPAIEAVVPAIAAALSQCAAEVTAIGVTAIAAATVRQRLAPSLRDRPGLVYAVVGLLYLLVVAWGPTPAFRQPWSILIFAALTGLGVEAFRRLTVREAMVARPTP